MEVTIEVLEIDLASWSPEARAELAEKLLPKLLEPLNRKREELQDDGIEPNFEVTGDVDSAYVRATPSEAPGYRATLSAIEGAPFELFCSNVLKAMGATSAVVGQSHDQGVDFVGRNLPLCTPASVGARIHIIGQAKCYKLDNNVRETEMREFIGGAIKRVSDPQDELIYRAEPLAPVIYAFWTTSDFHHLARTYARQVGIWYLNGLGLAQLALKYKVPIP